jgi:alkaline phosphatase
MLLLGLLAGCTASASPVPRPTAPHNVIIFIGDGVGAAYWTAARLAAGQLAIAEFPVAGLTDTRSSDSDIGDSAAGATVYSAGVRTYNGAIGVGARCAGLYAADSARYNADPASCDPLESIFDLAGQAGMATGLVATSSVTHATPASFGARVPHRRMEPAIATQLAEGPIDVLLGGGRGYFDGTRRPDSTDLLAGLCREATCLGTADELESYAPDDRRLIGLFAPNSMPPAALRRPSLPAMTRTALDRLSRDPEGFVLMVEGSQPDWRGHDNAPLPAVVAEMLDFDAAIRLVLDFAREDGNTLVVVVADHETGGLSLNSGPGGDVVAAWTTGSHTAEMTPHFAFGPGAESYGGMRDNEEIGRLLMAAVRARIR